jgi:hypothetical protein
MKPGIDADGTAHSEAGHAEPAPLLVSPSRDGPIIHLGSALTRTRALSTPTQQGQYTKRKR